MCMRCVVLYMHTVYLFSFICIQCEQKTSTSTLVFDSTVVDRKVHVHVERFATLQLEVY